MCFCGVIVIGYLGFSNGYEYDEYLNGTEVSFQDSVFGVSAAAYNPLLVGLTIVRGAGAQGAGTILSLSLSYRWIVIYFGLPSLLIVYFT